MKKCAVRLLSLVLTFAFLFSSSVFIPVTSAPIKTQSVQVSCLAPVMSGNDASEIRDTAAELGLSSSSGSSNGGKVQYAGGMFNVLTPLLANPVLRVLVLSIFIMFFAPVQPAYASGARENEITRQDDRESSVEIPLAVSNVASTNQINFWATNGSSCTSKEIKLNADGSPTISISGHLADTNGWYNAAAIQCQWNENNLRNLHEQALTIEWTLSSDSDEHRGILVSVNDADGNEATVELFPENFNQGDTYTSVVSASKLAGTDVKISRISQISILPDYRTSFGENGAAIVADFTLTVNANIGNSNMWGTSDPAAKVTGESDIDVFFWSSEDSYFTSKQLRLDPNGGAPTLSFTGHIDDTDEWFNAISAQYSWDSENLLNLQDESLEFTWSLTSSSDEHRGILVILNDKAGREKTIEIFPEDFVLGQLYTTVITKDDISGLGFSKDEIAHINIVADNRGADKKTGIVADIGLSVSGNFVQTASFMPWTAAQTSQTLALSDNHFGDISFWATDGSSFSSKQVRLDPDGGLPVLSVSGHVSADGQYYNAAATQCTWGADNMRDLKTDPIDINWSLTTDAAGQEGIIVIIKDDKGEGATVFLFPEDFESGKAYSSVINIDNVDTRYTKIDLSRIVEMYIFPDHRTGADTALVSNFSLNLSGDFLTPSSALPWGVERVVDAVVATEDYILRTMPYGDSAAFAGVWVPDGVNASKVNGDIYVQYGEENFPYARFSGQTVKADDGASVPVVAYFSLNDALQFYDLRAMEMSVRPSEGVEAVRIEYTDDAGQTYSFIVEGLEPGVWNRIQIAGDNTGAGLIDATKGRNISFSPVGVEGKFTIDVSMGQTDAIGFADKVAPIKAARNSEIDTTVLPSANVAFMVKNANSSWTIDDDFYVRTLVSAGDTLLIETSPEEVAQAMDESDGALRFVVDYGKEMTFTVFDTSGRKTSFDLTPVESSSGYWTIELSREYLDYLFAASGRQMADPDGICQIQMTFTKRPADGIVSIKDITESSSAVWNSYERGLVGTNDVALPGVFHFSEGVGYTVNDAQANVYQPNPGVEAPDTVMDVESIGRESEVAVEFEASINADKLAFTFEKEGLLEFLPEDGSDVNGDIVIVVSERDMSKAWEFVLPLASIDLDAVEDFDYLTAGINLKELGLDVPRNKTLKFQIKIKNSDSAGTLGSGRLTIVELGMNLNPHANPVSVSFNENSFPDEYTYLRNGTVDSRNMRLNTINTGGSNLFDESDGYVPFGGEANFDTAIRGFASIGAKGSGRDYASVYIYGSVIAQYPDDSVAMAFDISRVPEDVDVRIAITDLSGNALAVLNVDRSKGVEIGSIVQSISELGFDSKDVRISLSVVNQGLNDYSGGFAIYFNTAFAANGMPRLAAAQGIRSLAAAPGIVRYETVVLEFVNNADVSALSLCA